MSEGFPLDGVTVVDLTQYVAGPYATQVLADLGARVIKVERPQFGDVYRRQGPVFRNGLSAAFLALNRGKDSVVLDITAADGQAQLHELLAGADVLVENMRPGTLARHGLDYARVSQRHPSLVYCSISGFGQTGPMARQGGYDLTLQALSGIMELTGHPDAPPAKVPVAALDFGSALYAVIGILAALRHRDAHGGGQWVQTSILETATAWLSMHITAFLFDGGEPQRNGTRSPFFAPYEAYRTADGYVVLVGTGGKQAWEDLCAALGIPALAEDPRFADNAGRVERAAELKAALEAVTSTASTAHWVRVMERGGIPHAPVQRLPQVLESEQLRALALVEEIEHPVAGPVPIVRLPISFDRLRSTSRRAPPLLEGERP